jgi:hypothetical protein
MAHTPLKISIPQVQDEVRYAWLNSYSPEATGRALDSIADEPAPYKISHMVSRLFFRGIYFPQKGTWNWLKLIAQNRAPIYRIVKDSFARWHGKKDPSAVPDFNGEVQTESGSD